MLYTLELRKNINMSVAADIEIRKLRPAELCTLGQILNISDSWKKLMAVVPKEGCINVPKFNSEHFTLIENAVQRQRRNAAEIFLDEWSTMGRKRPTLGTLLDLLVKAELFRAADYVAGDILKGELPKRPECGPAAAVDISDETIVKLLREQAALSSDTFSESSVIFGTPLEHKVDKVIYFPETSLEGVEGNNANLRSTKLASANDEANVKGSGIGDNNVAENVQVSDLMKFSSAEIPNLSALMPRDSDGASPSANTSESKQESRSGNMPILVQKFALPGHMYNKQELLSAELPTVLNEIGQIGVARDCEIKTDELPACLNSQFISNSSRSSNTTSTNDSSGVSIGSNESASREDSKNVLEMTSAELPQCVIELRQNLPETVVNDPTELMGNIAMGAQNVMYSQDLPITVLEYSKHS